MDLEKKASQQTILAVLLGIIILAGMAFLLYNQNNALHEAREQVEQEKLACRQAEARLTDLIKLSKEAPALEERKINYEQLIPADPGENLLITGIQGLADKSNTHFLGIKFDKRISKDGYEEMPIQLTFEGRYHGLLMLLDNIPKWNRAVRINEVKVLKGKEELPQIKADISAAAFYEKQGKEQK